MKKFLSLLLAAMMLLSCATAMATETEPDENNGSNTAAKSFDSVTNGSATWLEENETGDADLDVSVSTNYDSGENVFGKEGEAATEIWLQVDATGQIDVTVPLVLVFQTNIDGGEATSPTDYKIVNHSTANLVVTKITTTEVAYDEKKQPMDLVAWTDSAANLDEDTYCVQIHDITGVPGTGKKDATYDLSTAEYEQQAFKGGLFQLEKAPAKEETDGTGTTTDLQVSMKTGRLSFVTHRTQSGDTDTMTSERGIQLLTITYTVAIDTSDAFGEVITTEATRESTVLNGANSEGNNHTKINEKTSSADSEEDNTADNPSTGGNNGGGTNGDENTNGD